MINEIRLQQYRSYIDQTYVLDKGTNFIVGPNASGKTNLLEALMVVCMGSSYHANDANLGMHNKSWARVDTRCDEDKRTLKIILNPLPEKEFVINDKIFKRLNLNTKKPVILFEPNHLTMLTGSPELRRGYLDGILDLIKPNYKKARNDYLKTLRQRNALLKSGKANGTVIFPWNVRLSHLGGIIAIARAELVEEELNKNINEIYSLLTGSNKKIKLVYRPTVEINSYESRLLRKLEHEYSADLIKGFTAHGPHRENLEVFINNYPIEVVASRGEARTIIVALKVLESEIVKEQLRQEPLVLLDDIFSELDKDRAKLLAHFLKNYQAVITMTDLNDNVAPEGNIIRMKAS